MRFTLWMAFLATAAALAIRADGPADTYWTVDNGGKALVLASALRGETTLPYPGAALDPAFAVYPLPLGGREPYATLHHGRVHSQYASPFVWLTAPVAAAFGLAGLSFLSLGLLPAVGAGLSVLAAGKLGARLGGDRAGLVAAAITLFASPLLFYGSVFWEHTLTIAAVGFAFGGLAAEKSRALPTGLWLALAAFLREELALLLPAFAIAIVLTRGSWRGLPVLLGAGALGPTALAVFHRVTSGSWFGPHLDANPPTPFAHYDQAFHALLIDGGPSATSATLTIGAIMLLAALASRLRRTAAGPIRIPHFDRVRGGLAVAACAALAFVSLRAWLHFPGDEDSALALRHANAAVLFLPWALALPTFARGRIARRVAIAAGAFVIAFCALVPERSITGVHMGPRMLLVLLPAVAALAGAGLTRSTTVWRLAAVPVLLAAVLWNVRSVELLHTKRFVAGEVRTAIAAAEETIVVTELFWLPTEMASLWPEKHFYLVSDTETFRDLAARARAAGHASLLAVAPLSADGTPTSPGGTIVFDPRLPAFSVQLLRVPLARETP